MRLFKPAVILLVLLLAAMIIVPIASAAPNKVMDVNFVSVEKATTVANFYVNQISSSTQKYSDWKGAVVQKATTYYDLNGKESAYSFDVLQHGQYAGYLIVSATRNNYPVLEFSKGKTPDREMSTQTEAKELATTVAKSQQASLGSGRPLYLGATFFYMEYPVEKTSTVKTTTQQSQENIYVDLYERKIVDQGKVSGTLSTSQSSNTEPTAAQAQTSITFDQKAIQNFQIQTKQEAQAEWNAIDGKITKNGVNQPAVELSAVQSGQTKYIDHVPYYDWTYGCSPTAGSMVVGYWRDQGLTRIPVSTNTITGDPVTKELADAMGTLYGSNYCQCWIIPIINKKICNPLCGFTVPVMIAPGINSELNKYQYGITNSQYGWNAGNIYFPSWSDFQNEIDAGRPFELSMTSGGAPEDQPNTPYNHHSVAAVGYMVTSFDNFVTIHDTWETPSLYYDHMIRYNNWAAAMNTWVRSRTYSITSSAGSNGKIDPAGTINVPSGTRWSYTITPDSGYIIDQILVDNSPVTQNPYTFSDVTSDHTITATFKEEALPAIVPLCQAGDAFDATMYPQNWPQSDPMTFSCNWDGNGRVYLSGSSSELIGTYADDGFTVDTPNGIQFDAEGHYAHQHAPLELTSGMNTGSNTLTLIVRNYMGLSMSYGSSTGIGTDQTPYIIEVNDQSMIAAAQSSAAKAFTFVPNSTELKESVSTTAI